MRVHYVQHVPFEGLGAIEPWIRARGFTLCATRLFAGDVLPPLADFDWLIVMGGPMGVADEARYPWLAQEKRMIREAVDANKTVLGICLGAQLIAHALDAEVTQNRYKEIGWFVVERCEEARHSALTQRLPSRLLAFHWHGDAFALPAGAIPLY